jgi:hypothetical protein
MAKLTILLVLLLVTFGSVASGAEATDIGTKKLGDCIDLIQTCADCTYVNFTSYTRPNGTRVVNEWAGVKNGVSFTYHSCNITDQLGEWWIDGHGNMQGTDTVFAYPYWVTTTGNPTPDGMPMFQMGILIIVFGISCFLLYLSSQMNEVGFKIFFLIASLIFLAATMLTAYMVSMDGNVPVATNTTTLSLFVVLGMVIVIIFIYVLIRQTINVLDMFRIKRGLKMENNVGLGSSVGGYNTKRAY